ncbi:MAG TPA: tetratricopeptide repeat protein [Candidatus Limnocylindrales bacterium]
MAPFAPNREEAPARGWRMPSRTPPRPVIFLAAAIMIAAGTWGARALSATPTPRAVQAPAAGSTPVPRSSALPVTPPDSVPGAGVDAGVDGPTATAALDKAIGVWTANLRDDPEDFVSAQNLALDYYTRGRLTGNVDDYDRAKRAIDLSLGVYPDDPGAKTMGALLQYTLHDFAGSLATAQAVFSADATQLQALATIGDDQLELGEYGSAGATFASLDEAAPGAAVTARRAHLASLEGRDDDAARLAARAAAEAHAEGADGSGLSFYEYLVGYIAFQAGRLEDADAAFGRALADWPGSYLALEGRARVRAAQGRTVDAAALYRKAIAIVPQPQFLAGLGDLYALGGDAKAAEQQYAEVRFIARLESLQAQVLNRQLVLFDVNHGENLVGALSMAERELAVRKDVYGWDAYAWALLANGRAVEARAAMRQALDMGTHDALLDYHAGVIAHAVGDDATARAELHTALSLNPGFDLLQAQKARQLLAALGS